MPIQVWSDSIWVVKLGDEPSLSEDLAAVCDRAAAQVQMPHVVLDLAGVAQVNSSNLAQVLRLRKAVVARDAKLRLAGVRDAVWAVFLTTGLEQVFDFVPDVPTALAGLQMGR